MQTETQAAPAANTAPPSMRLAVAKPLPGRSAFIPALLLALAFVGWLGFQSTQLLLERQQLGAARINLDQQVEAATKVRASLDALATATVKLAGDGNSTARSIVEDLRKRGITITPGGAASKPQ